MPAIILCLFSSYFVLKQGYRPARFLFLTHAILSLATSITWLSIADLVPYDVSLAFFGKPTDSPAPTSFMVVGALEMLLLSLALADRIKKLQAEKQAAEESAKLKTTFLAIMSHEIRTPLNGVLSMVKLLAKTPLNEEQRKYTDNIDYSGNALLSLLNDVLDYSKMEHQQIELETISFDPT
jgi:signal transduction histidine kinase